MRNLDAFRWLLAAGALMSSSFATAQNAVHISEFHYDNAGTDTGEAIEVSGPAGTDLSNWAVVLYNGTGGASYNTQTLSGVIPATCGARGVVVINYPANGIQNGSPDGIALVDAGGAPVEFISYEGVFTATNGPASGLLSADIGVSEAGTEAAGQSLRRDVNGNWSGPAAATFGACNDGEPPPPADVASVGVAPASATLNVGSSQAFTASALDGSSQPVSGVTFTWSSSNPAVATVNSSGMATAVAAGDATIIATAPNGIAGASSLHVNTAPPPPPPGAIHFSEIHYDNSGTDVGEAIEIEGPPGTDVSGFSIVLYDGNGGGVYGTTTLSGILPASCDARGVLAVNYPANGIQNGSPDGMALIDAGGQLLEFLSYEGSFTATSGPAAGVASTDIVASESTSAPVGGSLQRDSSNHWSLGTASFGACNTDTPPPPPGNTLSFTGRLATDPPLPVGYEDQLFATLHDASNATIATTITWTTETPAVATIDAAGVMHALSEGTAILRATAADGTTATYSLPTKVAVASGVLYPGNTEFGEPADADPSDDFIVRHEQFTASYNPNRGEPNWVSYDLDAAHFGAEDRCDCFTMDADLPASFPRITTDDYTGAGTFAGFGIDRGHMTRSFDRTTGSLDNARTYLFSNVVPQASDLNQGPWAMLENDLGDMARVDGKEVYIITGPAGDKGTLKGLGRVVIPISTWKVAVIMPHDQGLADIHDYRDLQVIAVNMPNDAGVRNVPWQTYLTTVDAIEALTGYDLLALLPDDVEAAVESNTQPPIGSITGPASAIAEGDSATFSASGSLDPNGTVVSYAWDFGDGSIGTGVSATHVFAQDGTFSVRLTLTDNDGLTSSRAFNLAVDNVAPVIGSIANAQVTVGANYSLSGSFTDPGADPWKATVDWGDGTSQGPQNLTGHDFSLVHSYAAAGTYTATITIADDDAIGSRAVTVQVTDPAPTLSDAATLIDQLVASRKITSVVGLALKAELRSAQMLIARGRDDAARTVLRAMVAELDLLVRLRAASAADLAPLRAVLVQASG